MSSVDQSDPKSQTVIYNAGNTWVFNAKTNTGTHSIDTMPPLEFHCPVCPSEMLQRYARLREFCLGEEIDFMTKQGIKPTHMAPKQGVPYDFYETDLDDLTVRLYLSTISKLPTKAEFSIKDHVVLSIIYDTYTQGFADPSLFQPPAEVHFTESAPPPR